MVPPQRESPLKPKQSEKKPNQQWVADIVHERNLWHTLAFYFCTVSSAEHKKNAQQHCTTNRDRQFGAVIVAGFLECAGAPALLECLPRERKV